MFGFGKSIEKPEFDEEKCESEKAEYTKNNQELANSEVIKKLEDYRKMREDVLSKLQDLYPLRGEIATDIEITDGGVKDTMVAVNELRAAFDKAFPEF